MLTLGLRITIRFNALYVDALSKSLPPPREKHFEPQKVLRDPGALTILTSKWLSHHGVVQILRLELHEVRRNSQLLTILTSKSLSRHSVVQMLGTSWAADPPHTPVFRSWLSEPAKPQNYGKTQHFAHFYPNKTSSSHTPELYHICAITSLGWQIFGGNSQYSRKLDS